MRGSEHAYVISSNQATCSTHPEPHRPAHVLWRPALLCQVGVEIHVLGTQTHALARKQQKGLRRYLSEGIERTETIAVNKLSKSCKV